LSCALRTCLDCSRIFDDDLSTRRSPARGPRRPSRSRRARHLRCHDDGGSSFTPNGPDPSLDRRAADPHRRRDLAHAHPPRTQLAHVVLIETSTGAAETCTPTSYALFRPRPSAWPREPPSCGP
jgi:hypothetical protein